MNNSVNARCSWGDMGCIAAFGQNVHVMKKYRKTYLREWRKASNRTLEAVAGYLHISHAQLSKIERGIQPYNQALLEALAELYMCEPADLIIRGPGDPDGIWAMWENANYADRAKIIQVAKTILGLAA